MVLHWFRRDLRLNDNSALKLAQSSGKDVQCIFIFDKNILDRLEDEFDPRVTFIYNELKEIDAELRKNGSSLWVFYGDPIAINKILLKTHPEIDSIYLNRDYEPYAIKRDKEIAELYMDCGKSFFDSKDHVIFEKNEIVKNDGTPYSVYSPYARRWLDQLKESNYTSENILIDDISWFKSKINHYPLPSLKSMGFNESHLNIPSRIPDLNVIKNYDKSRNFPAIKNGTSHLGVHLRFGTISIRSLVKLALDKNKVFISELIWRDFYQMVLFHNQHSINKAIKPAYDRIEWLFDKEQFEGWCNGKTGYPMVDAGMRELNNTGFMHNRVRMVAASFLTKHLLHDWRLGEAYFAKKLLDFDLASNIGGWQWASGSGCDAAPYFRIFNPTSQFEKFDNSKAYVEKWVPELYTEEYPKPIVEHKWARERALRVYKEGLSSI